MDKRCENALGHCKRELKAVRAKLKDLKQRSEIVEQICLEQQKELEQLRNQEKGRDIQ